MARNKRKLTQFMAHVMRMNAVRKRIKGTQKKVARWIPKKMKNKSRSFPRSLLCLILEPKKVGRQLQVTLKANSLWENKNLNNQSKKYKKRIQTKKEKKRIKKWTTISKKSEHKTSKSAQMITTSTKVTTRYQKMPENGTISKTTS